MNDNFEKRCLKFGYDFFGPFLMGFSLWLKSSVEKNKIDKFFFFARDGYMMEKAFDILFKAEFTHRYLYFSRQSLRQALLYHETEYSDSLRYVTKERYISIAKILRYYGFFPEECKEIAEEFHLDLKNEYLLNELNRVEEIKNIYQRYQKCIHEKSRKQAELLKAYLNQNDFSGKCAIVDIGWHGSMQYYLERFVEAEHLDAHIFGFYVGINPIEELNGEVHGYIFEPGKLEKRKAVLCFLGGYEKLFQSKEGSTIGYQKKNGVVSPVLMEYEYKGNDRICSIIQAWQDSALVYIEEKAEMLDVTNPANKLIHFGKNPPLWGIDMFKDFYITDGGKQYFVSSKPLVKYSLKELKHEISNCVWKTGFMKSLLRLPLPYFTIYKVIRK